MGGHVTFFLHISSAPDQANNFLALAFGVFVTGLIVFASIMIMVRHNPQHDANGRVNEDAALERLGCPRYKI